MRAVRVVIVRPMSVRKMRVVVMRPVTVREMRVVAVRLVVMWPMSVGVVAMRCVSVVQLLLPHVRCPPPRCRSLLLYTGVRLLVADR